jgi:ribosomal protein S18 acetylase RimI-like enzyme
MVSVKNTNVKIRKAKKKDLPQLKKLCFEGHKEIAQYSEDMVVDKYTKKEINQEMKRVDPFSIRFVAEKGKEIVGNVSIMVCPHLRKEGTIYGLFVIKSQRRKGIGTKLMLKALEYLKKKSVKRVRVIVHRKNKIALSFLKKFNFSKEPIKVFWLTKRL